MAVNHKYGVGVQPYCVQYTPELQGNILADWKVKYLSDGLVNHHKYKVVLEHYILPLLDLFGTVQQKDGWRRGIRILRNLWYCSVGNLPSMSGPEFQTGWKHTLPILIRS